MPFLKSIICFHFSPLDVAHRDPEQDAHVGIGDGSAPDPDQGRTARSNTRLQGQIKLVFIVLFSSLFIFLWVYGLT